MNVGAEQGFGTSCGLFAGLVPAIVRFEIAGPRSARFNVTPRNVKAGHSVTVRGNLCKPGSYVTIKLDGELIGEDRANNKGNFIGGHRIPEDTSRRAHTVSARCHGKFVGSQLIDVERSYPAPSNLLTTDRRRT